MHHRYTHYYTNISEYYYPFTTPTSKMSVAQNISPTIVGRITPTSRAPTNTPLIITIIAIIRANIMGLNYANNYRNDYMCTTPNKRTLFWLLQLSPPFSSLLPAQAYFALLSRYV